MENGREFVVPLKLAYLITEMGDLCPFSIDDVKILVPKKSWGLICREGIECKQIEQDYDTWEREFILRNNSITCAEPQKNPRKYVVSMNLWSINQLTDIQPKDAI